MNAKERAQSMARLAERERRGERLDSAETSAILKPRPKGKAAKVSAKQKERGVAKVNKVKVVNASPTSGETPQTTAAAPHVAPRSKEVASLAGAVPPTRRQEIRLVTGGYCLCGCGQAANARRLFVQGHDARLKGQLLRLGRGELTVDQLTPQVRQLLPTLDHCSCCGSPVWLGKSECDHKTCNCKLRAEVAKANGKVKNSKNGSSKAIPTISTIAV